MTTPFGPQLIGETEKTLIALLLRNLEGTGLTEPQWVTLRLAGLLDGSVDTDGLTAAVANRAHFTDADQLVGALTARGLLDDGRLTPAGRDVVAEVQAASADTTDVIWDGLSADDVAATTRVLNEVLERAHAALAR
jgi:hypothetical protein